MSPRSATELRALCTGLPASLSWSVFDARARTSSRPLMETISFARGAPAPDLLPVDELADCAETVLARGGKTILSYGAGAGYTPLRELVGEWFAVHPSRVLLTNGGLQALDLLTRAVARGRSMMCEWPTYDRAYKVFLDGGASIVVAEVD